MTKNPLKINNFHLAFMADEGCEGQNLVLAIWMLCKVKIEAQYANTKEVIQEGPLNQIFINHSLSL